MPLNETDLNSSSTSRSLQSNPEGSSFALSKQKKGIELMKHYLLKKAENMYKLNFSDEEAFKWKFHKNKSNRPLSSFRLIKKEQQHEVPSITLEDLKDFRFPVLAFKTKELASFATMILKENQYFMQQFNDEKFLEKLVTEISINYNIVSYHNFSHGFSLSLMLYQAFQYHKEFINLYNEQERFYAILAGLAHDLNHPGTNNAFEVKTKSSRALQFNNESVLQNFHIKSLWKLIERNPEINFLLKVNNAQYVKKYITHLILMTDVAQHFKNLQKLKALNKQAQQSGVPILQNAENREVIFCFKKFFLGQLFHACDIGNPCIDFDNYISWAALLSYEFNEQTILEKENNVEVTEMLRYKDLTTFYKGQTGFISNFFILWTDFMVFPLWKEIVVTCDGLSVFTENVQTNVKMLTQKIETSAKEEEQMVKGLDF